MNRQKIVIIGGVAGGMSAATRLRRLDEYAEIHIIEQGPYVSFANCGLPYYISGAIAERENLLVQTPQQLKNRFDLDVHVNTKAIKIDPEEQKVVIEKDNQIEELSYDKLIVSPGASPIIPPIEGLNESNNVFTVRNIPDIDKIKNYLDEHTNLKTATVIGAGFIGLEMAENFRNFGLDVNIVQLSDHVLPTLDLEMAEYLHKELEKNGVNLYTNVSAQQLTNNGKKIVLSDGNSLETDLIILAVGVMPNSELLKDAGAVLGDKGGIVVDENYETSLNNIYAIGDATLTKNTITNQNVLIPLASPANRQGRQVADVIASHKSKVNKGSIGTSIVKVFNLAAAQTGLNEQQLKQNDIPYHAMHLIGKDHASYYPNAQDIYLKVLFEKEKGKILGAQAVGKTGVDKRIDVLATAIKNHMKVDELQELELTYAPPFGVAKDVVNMAGYVGENILLGVSESVQFYEIEELINSKGHQLLDVRTKEELQTIGTFDVPYINIPLNDLRDNLDQLDKKQKYIITCQASVRGYIAERILRQHGFTVKNLDGGYRIAHTK